MKRQNTDSWGRKIKYKHQYNINVFTTKNDIFYYLLGAFMTDGNVYFYKNRAGSKSSLSSNDTDWLQSINDLICPTNLISKKGNELKIFDNIISKILNRNGCHPNKSLTLRMPKVPKKYLADFFRGCIDGDGSVYITNKKIDRKYKVYYYKQSTCYLCSASKEFIAEASKILHTLGFKHYLITLKQRGNRKIRGRTIKSSKPMYRLLFNNNDCKNFLEWIYYPNHKLCMKRKFTIAKTICSTKN